MNQQLAQKLKTEGLAATAAANLDWCHLMRPVLVSWLEHRTAAGNRTFRMEEFRAYCAEVGENWLPSSHKTWGAFANALLREGVIQWTGRMEPAQSAATHGHWVRTYRRAVQ
jgi:hypothetical protein